MTTHPQKPQPNRQTLYVAIALVLGILVGELLNLTLGGSGLAKPNPALSQYHRDFYRINRYFSPPGQNDHRAAGVFHAGGRHGQNGRYSNRRTHRHQGAALVFLGFIVQPVAGHVAGQRV